MTMAEKMINTLDSLDDNDIIVFGEDGMPAKKDHRHLRHNEVMAVILEHVIRDIKVSSRELARATGLDARTVNKVRRSEAFVTLLMEHVNKKMLHVRCLAVEELEKLLNDEDLNPNIKIKAIHEALSHSERMVELALLAKKDVPVINVNDLIKELEGM